MERRGTVQNGMVVLDDRSSKKKLEDIKTPVEMLEYFEYHAQFSWVDGKTPTMLLQVCPICNGLDPEDSNAALPHLRELYKKNAGHKPGCKLDEMIARASYIQEFAAIMQQSLISNSVGTLSSNAKNSEGFPPL